MRYSKKFLIDERKKQSRTSSDVQIKEFLLTKQKTRPRTDYRGFEETISEKSDKNI